MQRSCRGQAGGGHGSCRGIHRGQHCNWILVRELAVLGKGPHAEHDDDAAATKDCRSTHTIRSATCDTAFLHNMHE